MFFLGFFLVQMKNIKRKLFLFLFQASFKYIDRELMKRLLCYFFLIYTCLKVWQ